MASNSDNARDLFVSILGIDPNSEAVSDARRAAALWRKDGHYYLAGHAMDRAVRYAWGDDETMASCAAIAINDFERCIEISKTSDWEALVALWRASSLVKLFVLFGDPFGGPTRIHAYRSELAHRLVESFRKDPKGDSFCVKGFALATDLAGNWQTPLF